MERPVAMTQPETVAVRVDDVRRILHHYNNLAAQLLTKSELALLSGDAALREDALRRVGDISEQLGRHTREARTLLLGEQA
jgi:hypothetical protein